MARRSDHTRDELRELAVNSAVKIITEEGLKAFSARRVATEIGYTVGTLYNVFENYDDLLLHANARTLDHWFEFMAARMARSGKAEPLRVLARGYIDYARTHYNRWIALFEQHNKDETIPDWYQSKLGRFFVMLENVILPHTRSDPRKAKRDAQVLWAGIHGIAILSLTGKFELLGADSPDSLAQVLVDNYLKA